MDLPKALLLDLDDTILDLYRDPGEAWIEVCGEFAGRLEGVDPEALHAQVLASQDRYWSDPERARRGRLNLPQAARDVLTAAFDHLGIPTSPMVASMAGRQRAILEEAVRPFPGAIDTLRRLRDEGMPLALVTNAGAETQRRKIERFSLEEFFEHIQIEGEFGIGKPDERAFRNALDALGVGPADAWMVGDNLEFDIAGAQRAGIYAVWVDARGAGLPEGTATRPDRTIRALSDLIA